jgi:ABC-2 type transport system permease protein
MKQIPNNNETVNIEARKRHGRSVMLAVLLCLVVAATYLINAVAYGLSQRYPLSLDLTANAAYEIGPETKSLLGALDKDVDIYVLARPDSYGINSYFLQMQHIMELYPKMSGHVTLTYIDFAYDPTFASRFPDLSLQQGDILVVRGDKVKQLHLNQMFNYTQTQEGNLKIISSRAEEALTSAFLYVMTDEQIEVAVLTGNSVAEMSPFSTLLADNNYVVSNVNIATEPLNDKYDIALLLAPQVDLSEDALKKLGDFLYNNGKYGKMLVYTADATQQAMTNINTFLAGWGVSVGDGAVFETTETRTYQSQPFYPVVDYTNDKYRDMLKDASMPVLMPLSRPLSQLFEVKGDVSTEVLLSFGSSTAVLPPDAGEDFSPSKATQKGPFPSMILSTKSIYNTSGMLAGKSSVLVASSTNMLDSFCIQNTSLSNGSYMLNIFNDVFQRTDVVNIEPKSLAGRTLAITTAEAGTIGLVLAGVIPLLILASGIVIWFVRRYK